MMDGPDFDKWLDELEHLDAEAAVLSIRAHPLSNTEQVSWLLDQCSTADEARAVLETSPDLAREHAEHVAAYRSFAAPNVEAEALYRSVRAAPTAQAAGMLLSMASADVCSIVAAWLTLDRSNAQEIGQHYSHWILNEESTS